MAERSSSECTDGDNDNYFSKLLFAASYPGGCGDFGTDPDTPCLPTICPGIDVVMGLRNGLVLLI